MFPAAAGPKLLVTDFGGDALSGRSSPKAVPSSPTRARSPGLLGDPRRSSGIEPPINRFRTATPDRARTSASTALRFDVETMEPKIILGRGGFAWVRLSQHTPSGSFYAVKGVRKSTTASRNAIADLVDEKKAAIALSNSTCPFVPKFFGTYQVCTRASVLIACVSTAASCVCLTCLVV